MEKYKRLIQQYKETSKTIIASGILPRINGCDPFYNKVLSTNTQNTVVASEITPCPITDHDLISATINLHKPERQPLLFTKRQLRNYSPAFLLLLFFFFFFFFFSSLSSIPFPFLPFPSLPFYCVHFASVSSPLPSIYSSPSLLPFHFRLFFPFLSLLFAYKINGKGEESGRV